MPQILLLLLYISGCIGLNVYWLKNSSSSKGNFVSQQARAFSILWRIWGASLWFMPALIWITLPPVKAALAEPELSFTPYLLLGVGFYIPLLVFVGLVGWLKIIKGSALSTLALVPLVFLLVLVIGPQSALPMIQWIPFLFIVTIPPIFSILLLVGWVEALIPVETGEEHGQRNAIALLVSFFTGKPKPTWVIEHGEPQLHIKGSPMMGTGPGWVMTEPENAVILKGRASIRRVAGPGGIFTRRDETVHDVIDLRPQIRTTRVQAITQDGIKVTLPINTIFSVDPGPGMIRLKRRWPFMREAAWRAVFAAEVNPSNRTPLDAHQPRPWSNLPLNMGKTMLKQMITDYSLDTLYNTPNDQQLPRLQISAQVQAQVQELITPHGFFMTAWTINKIVPVDDAVTQQRIEAWKSRWVRQLMEWQGEVHARRIEQFSALQDKMRLDLLSGFITRTNDFLLDAEDEFRINLVVYHLIESLERIAQDPEIQSILPESALPALEDLRQHLDKEHHDE